MTEHPREKMEKCLFCQRKEETHVTGALSSKGRVTAHQNCLLYASGIFCQESPEMDDLFGFSENDVLKERKRGAKLECKKCLKKGATVGCEVGRCKKSYHYPCAIEAGAQIFEDETKGKFGIFCINHTPQKMNPVSNGESSAVSSSENSKKQRKPKKRRLVSDDKQDDSPSKKKHPWTRIIFNESTSSEEMDTDIGLLPPIESDLEDNVNSSFEQETNGITAESPSRPPSVNQMEEDNTALHSDAESESLIPSRHISINSQLNPETGTQTVPQTSYSCIKSEAMPLENSDNGFRHEDSPSRPPTEPSFPKPGTSPSSAHPTLSNPETHERPPPSASLDVSSSPRETNHVAPSPPPSSSHVNNITEIDSSCFWKSCNMAGCTQAIFTDFLSGIKDIAERIQGGQASQEDYDLALSVMAASGKLLHFVAKQQKAIQGKLADLQSAEAAMRDVVTALQGGETTQS